MDDKSLLDLIKKDPSAGMDRLMNDYAGLVYATVRGRLAGAGCVSSDAEDCVADTFSKFYASVSKFDPVRSSIKTYLCVMARNNAADILRKRGRQAGELSLDNDELLFEIPDGSEPDSDLARREQRRRVIDAVDALGEPDASIIFRKYYYGQTSKEIGRVLGLTAANVDTRAHRALNRLRKILGGEK